MSAELLVKLTSEHLSKLHCADSYYVKQLKAFAPLANECAAELGVPADALVDDKGADGVRIHPTLLAKLLGDTNVPAANADNKTVGVKRGADDTAVAATDALVEKMTAVVQSEGRRTRRRVEAQEKQLVAVSQQLVAVQHDQMVLLECFRDTKAELKAAREELKATKAELKATKEQLNAVRDAQKRHYDKTVEVNEFWEGRHNDEFATMLEAIKREVSGTQVDAKKTGAPLTHLNYMQKVDFQPRPLTARQSALLFEVVRAEHNAKKTRGEQVGPITMRTVRSNVPNFDGRLTQPTIVLHDIDQDVFERTFANPQAFEVFADGEDPAPGDLRVNRPRKKQLRQQQQQ